MVSPVDQGRAPLEPLDKEAEEMGLIGIIDALDTSFGDDAAAVGLECGS